MQRYEDVAEPATERLLETSWEGRARQASERELVVDAIAAALFVAVAGAPGRPAQSTRGEASRGVAALLIAVYALVARIEFPVGAGYVVPTQLVLVPMLLMLPPAGRARRGRLRAWPSATRSIGCSVGSRRAGSSPRCPTRGMRSARPLVLLLAGSPTIGFDQLPLLAVALAAGCLVDLTCSLVRMRFAGVLPELGLQIRVIALVWAVDACLAPLGLPGRDRHPPATPRRSCSCCRWYSCSGCWRATEISASSRLTSGSNSSSRSGRVCNPRCAGWATRSPPSSSSSGLLEILLHGSIEALDAGAGRLELTGRTLAHPSLSRRSRLGSTPWTAAGGQGAEDPVQIGRGGVWRLSAPMRIAASPTGIAGSLWLVRAGRAFEEDEIALIVGARRQGRAGGGRDRRPPRDPRAGDDRLAHRAGEPPQAQRPISASGVRATRSRRSLSPPAIRPRWLQGLQRHVRPPGRRRAARSSGRQAEPRRRRRSGVPTGSAATSSAPTSTWPARTRMNSSRPRRPR